MCYCIAMGKCACAIFPLFGWENDTYPFGWEERWTICWLIPIFGVIGLGLSYFKYLRFLRWSSYVGLAAVFGTILLVCSKGFSSIISGTAPALEAWPTSANIFQSIPALNMMAAAAANQYNGPMFYQNMLKKEDWGK